MQEDEVVAHWCGMCGPYEISGGCWHGKPVDLTLAEVRKTVVEWVDSPTPGRREQMLVWWRYVTGLEWPTEPPADLDSEIQAAVDGDMALSELPEDARAVANAIINRRVSVAANATRFAPERDQAPEPDHS